MAKIKAGGYTLDVDILELLSEFSWERPTWGSDKLLAASPFRYDNTPSFFVNLHTGGWKDSGAYDADYESGNLVKLLAFLRNETYEETLEYLVDLYGVREHQEGERIKIPSLTIREQSTRVELDEGALNPYMYRHEYLKTRGINERTQRFMGVGYSKESRAVVLPWRHADGVLANMKFRKIYGKTFWYMRGAAPVRTLVYGIDKVYKFGLKDVVICEAEIDALSWWSSGRPAIAIGGTAVSKIQLDAIRKSPIETLILAMDNDKAGEKMRQALVEGLSGYMSIQSVEIPADYKDANEALVAGISLGELDITSPF